MSRRPVDDYEACSWGVAPGNAIVVSSAMEMRERREIQNFLALAAKRYGNKTLQTQSPFSPDLSNNQQQPFSPRSSNQQQSSFNSQDPFNQGRSGNQGSSVNAGQFGDQAITNDINDGNLSCNCQLLTSINHCFILFIVSKFNLCYRSPRLQPQC